MHTQSTCIHFVYTCGAWVAPFWGSRFGCRAVGWAHNGEFSGSRTKNHGCMEPKGGSNVHRMDQGLGRP